MPDSVEIIDSVIEVTVTFPALGVLWAGADGGDSSTIYTGGYSDEA